MAQPTEPIASLQRLKKDLARIRVFIDGGDEKIIAVPNVRQRWQRITRTLDQLVWLKLEAENADGDVLAILENEDLPDPESEAGELEDISGDLANASTTLQQLVAAQEMVLRRHEKMSEITFAALTKVTEILSDQLGVQNEQYLEALGQTQTYASMAAEAELHNKADEETGLMGDPVVKRLMNSAMEGAAKGMVAKMSAPTAKE